MLGFSATQAIVIPPISESLKRRRKVPLGLDISMSWACCLFTKPNMALKKGREIYRDIKVVMCIPSPLLSFISILVYWQEPFQLPRLPWKILKVSCQDWQNGHRKTFTLTEHAVQLSNWKKRGSAFIFMFCNIFQPTIGTDKKPRQFPYPSFQCGLRCFFVSSMTPSNHCQNVKLLPGKLSCKQKVLGKKKKIFLKSTQDSSRHAYLLKGFHIPSCPSSP